MTHDRQHIALVFFLAIGIAAPAEANIDRIRDDQWHLRSLDVSEAHKHSLGDGVRVAVIDTGVDPHPDLRKNVLRGADMLSEFDSGRVDIDSHGTGMAGLIAAHGTAEGTGALGIAPKAAILPIRSGGSSSLVDSDLLAAGIRWAIKHDAKVINASSAGSPSAELRRAINAASAADIVVVAPAGNRPADFGASFPAAYDGVLAVAATDRQGNHADVSVTGPQVTISAPGVDIYSTSFKGLYRKGTGTSDAAAIVAGAVALVRSKYPELSAPEVVHRLTATATDKGPPGRDEQYGYGVLNLVAALTADVPALTPASPTLNTSAATAPPRGSDGSDRGGVWAAVVLAALAVGVTVGLVALRRRRPHGR